MDESPEHGITFDPTLRRLDVFLGMGDIDERSELVRRRILGVIQGVEPDADVDQLMQEHLADLDFQLLKADRTKLLSVLKRFFRREDISIIEVEPWHDRSIGLDKQNVLTVVIDVGGDRRVCYLKYIEEGPRRECLGLRINNLLTDSPVPFIASGFTMLQMEVRGIGWDEHPGFFNEADRREFHRGLGKADEFGRLITLGDRKPVDLLVLGKRAANIDFGAAFSRYETLARFAGQAEYMTDFEIGKIDARMIIRERFGQHREIVDALLARVDERVVRLMNEENKRQLFQIRENPAVLVRRYLEGIGMV